MRTESDLIGQMQVPEDVLYGIHALRATQNFPYKQEFSLAWYKSMGTVKLACYNTYVRFKQAALAKHEAQKLPFSFFDDSVINALQQAATEVSEGKFFDSFIVPALQGGAGTSINMNVNEIIANRALQIQGLQIGDYTQTDPVLHANIYQSTNDVVPTALKVAAMRLLLQLEESINKLRKEIETLEQSYRNHLRTGYTQMQEAVPSSFGKLFGNYNDALSRDWWRVSKCMERIKVVNLGGSAIGTSLAVPRFFVMNVVNELQKISGLPVARAENMTDATANLDTLVEVHAILKAHAVNLEKMVSDLRLLSSDLAGNAQISIPQRQTGSSIMPGKVNPVIPEFVISATRQVYSHDVLISDLAAQGCLELNAYLPSIGHALLSSLEILISANKSLTQNLFQGLTVNHQTAMEQVLKSPSVTTALSPYIGYHKASELAKYMKENKIDITQANHILKIIKPEILTELLKPENLLKAGFSLTEFDS